MKCKTHKSYRGIRKPTANCRKCKFIFRWRKFLNACGFPVAQVRRAPNSEAKKVEEFCKEFGVAVIDRGSDKNRFLPKTENFSAGLEGTATEGHIEPDFPVLTQDRQDALKLTLAELKAGAEARAKTWEADALALTKVVLKAKSDPAWRTPEVAALLQAHARGELTEHQSTALFLKLTDAGAFHRKEQVRNIGPGAKPE